MARELPSHANRDPENGKAGNNVSFHDLLPPTWDRLLGFLAKCRNPSEPTLVIDATPRMSQPLAIMLRLSGTVAGSGIAIGAARLIPPRIDIEERHIATDRLVAELG